MARTEVHWDEGILEKCRAAGYDALAGTDEAGRGPLAGPVYAAAVILPDGVIPEGLNDSKKLSHKQRKVLFDEICSKAAAWSIAFSDVEEIEEYNILGASLRAMRRAVDGLDLTPELVLVDGNRNTEFAVPSFCVVKGDARIPAIAAASILAKVSRDRVMLEMAEKYPGYGFEKHMGYPTRAHYEALDRLGPCPIHRPSFLRKWRASRE